MTPLQKQCLDFVTLYIGEHVGVSPSYAEIAAHLGLKSKSGVYRLISALIDRGYLASEITRQGNYSRSLTLVQPKRAELYELGWKDGYASGHKAAMRERESRVSHPSEFVQ